MLVDEKALEIASSGLTPSMQLVARNLIEAYETVKTGPLTEAEAVEIMYKAFTWGNISLEDSKVRLTHAFRALRSHLNEPERDEVIAAAQQWVSANTMVHPSLSRREAEDGAERRLHNAVNRLHSRQPATSTVIEGGSQ